MTEEQRSQSGKGPTPEGSVHNRPGLPAHAGGAAGLPAESTIRFFIAGFFNSLLASLAVGEGRSFRGAILPRFRDGDKRNREIELFK